MGLEKGETNRKQRKKDRPAGMLALDHQALFIVKEEGGEGERGGQMVPKKSSKNPIDQLKKGGRPPGPSSCGIEARAHSCKKDQKKKFGGGPEIVAEKARQAPT